jgi:hypothetical protein
MRDNIFAGKTDNKYLTLNFPSECPLLVLRQLGWRESKELESEEGKMIGSGLFWVMQQRKEIGQCLHRSRSRFL